MKFYKKNFYIYKDWITILPTIEIHTDDPRYFEKTVTVGFSWLVFHARIMFKGEEKSGGSNGR